MIDHPTTLLYLTLRSEGKIGRLWTEGENCHKLAPVDALPGLEYRQAEFISTPHLIELIYKLSGLGMPARKPPTSTSTSTSTSTGNWLSDTDLKTFQKRRA